MGLVGPTYEYIIYIYTESLERDSLKHKLWTQLSANLWFESNEAHMAIR